MSRTATSTAIARSQDRAQIDAMSTRPNQGSVQGLEDNTSYNPPDPAIAAALETGRLLDFLSNPEQTYSYRREQSVPASQRRMANKLHDLGLDQLFDHTSRRAATC